MAYCPAMKRELIATVAGRGIEISVEAGAEGRWQVGLAGEVRQVDTHPVRPGTWSLIIDGRAYLVDLDIAGTGTALSSRLAEAVAVIEDARKSGSPPPPTARASPAPARSCARQWPARSSGRGRDGDVVTVGQGVVVLEAMKMENELCAERGGTVTAIHKTAGKSINTGDLLVALT